MDTTKGDQSYELARALTSLLDSTRLRLLRDQPNELVVRVTGHLGCTLAEVPNVSASFPGWELVNLQRGLDAYLSQHSPHASWFGVSGAGRGHQDLIDMLATARHHGGYELGAVDYTTVATGPDTTAEAIALGLIRSNAPDGTPIIIGVRGPRASFGEPNATLQILAADRHAATAAIAAIEQLMFTHNIFAGQLLSFDHHEHRGNEMVTFLPRPQLAADEVVLPEGMLDLIERHVVRTPDQTRYLAEQGQHLKRGLLLHGDPGTGKTHTVRYLLSRLNHATAIVLSGPAISMLGTAVTLARRLAPSVLVLEDVDLIAEDRTMSYGSQPLLFELLNRIDGVDADVDVTFVLTTNRVDTMERALVDRPGRVDLAVEVPKPDADARERLLRLYARHAELTLPNPATLIDQMDGVTASFVRELVRRAVLASLADTPAHLTQDILQSVLDELDDERQALTRSLLGGRPPAQFGHP